jgi:PhzF family phenazine biosynthesis protein
MGSVRVYQVDAFTAERFAGNPAGVILDADGLSELQMRRLARELGSADNAFVLASDGVDHDLRVRFLTPRGEAAFIGHATLAVHAVLASIGEAPRPRQKQRSGVVQIDRLRGGATPSLAIHQPRAPLGAELDASALAELLQILGLTAAQLDARCAPRLAGASSPRVLLGVDTADTLARLKPDDRRLADLSGRLGAPGVFVFTLQPAVAGVHTEARMFCPALGFPEDPVSGNAHALLGIYLLQQRLLPGAAQAGPHGELEFTGAQGHHLDRPGRVRVRLSLRDAAVQTVSIIGDAVIAFSTTVSF